ncbi:unnamed protein product [Orchesella dallaii]|uniref:Uncharacterized protein n=1 Tax=Orchesella dallaii TaxID=48710 RepID=A0ABP1R2W7_9HEXA
MWCKPCCCFSSRTGAILAGILQLVASGLGVINLFTQIKALQNPTQEQRLIRWSQGSFGDSDTDPDKIFLAMFFGPLAIVLSILFASMLIHGIRKNYLYLIKAHLIYYILGTILTTVVTVVKLVSSEDIVTDFLTFLLSHFLKLYIIYVVYCAYLETQEKLSLANNAQHGNAPMMYAYTAAPLGCVQGVGLNYPDLYSENMRGQVRMSHSPTSHRYYPQPTSGHLGASSYPHPPQYYPQQLGKPGAGGRFYPQDSSSLQRQQGSSSPTESNGPRNPNGNDACDLPTSMFTVFASTGACAVM